MKNSLLIFIAIISLFGCKEGTGNYIPPNDEKVKKEKETLIHINKYLIQKDSDLIVSYIDHRNWEMEQTNTGLWHKFDHYGNGEKAKEKMSATIKYKISLLDGTLCYSSDETGPKTFTIGQGGVERGLEEGILLMHLGDKATFIMPPHLAYGLVGDNSKIPKRAIIVYEVELVALE